MSVNLPIPVDDLGPERLPLDVAEQVWDELECGDEPGFAPAAPPTPGPVPVVH